MPVMGADHKKADRPACISSQTESIHPFYRFARPRGLILGNPNCKEATKGSGGRRKARCKGISGRFKAYRCRPGPPENRTPGEGGAIVRDILANGSERAYVVAESADFKCRCR